MNTPFTTDRPEFWAQAPGLKVVAGPTIFVVVARAPQTLEQLFEMVKGNTE